MAGLNIKVVSNGDEIADLLNRMADHCAAAPESDPLLQAVMKHVEIDLERDIQKVIDVKGGLVTVTFALAPELQAIADMLPE